MQAFLLQTVDGGTRWPEALIALGGILMVTVVVAVAIVQVMAAWRARMSIAREDAYRQLAETTSAAQARLAEQQSEIAENVVAVRERLGRIEKVLQEID